MVVIAVTSIAVKGMRTHATKHPQRREGHPPSCPALGEINRLGLRCRVGFSPHYARDSRDDSEILERLPYRMADREMRELKRLRVEQVREPGNLDRALTFARRSIELGRTNWDPRYYGYAQAALRP
jgi:hypothetical protein